MPIFARATTIRSGRWGYRRSKRSENLAHRPSVRGAIAVTAIMRAGVTGLTRIAAEWIPAAMVCCAAYFEAINLEAMQMATVRVGIDRNEHDARECRGHKAEDQVARHGSPFRV